MLRRLMAAAIGLSLVGWAPASLLCPLDGGSASHAAHGQSTGAHAEHAPDDARGETPDCPVAFVAGCVPSVMASTAVLVLDPIADLAAQPHWLVASESELTATHSIFHPPIG